MRRGGRGACGQSPGCFGGGVSISCAGSWAERSRRARFLRGRARVAIASSKSERAASAVWAAVLAGRSGPWSGPWLVGWTPVRVRSPARWVTSAAVSVVPAVVVAVVINCERERIPRAACRPQTAACRQCHRRRDHRSRSTPRHWPMGLLPQRVRRPTMYYARSASVLGSCTCNMYGGCMGVVWGLHAGCMRVGQRRRFALHCLSSRIASPLHSALRARGAVL